jgi:hypothetical protein
VISRWSLVVVGCVACGDNSYRDEVFTATSGSRIALQAYRFDDGTEQPDSRQFYDAAEHTLWRAALDRRRAVRSGGRGCGACRCPVHESPRSQPDDRS